MEFGSDPVAPTQVCAYASCIPLVKPTTSFGINYDSTRHIALIENESLVAAILLRSCQLCTARSALFKVNQDRTITLLGQDLTNDDAMSLSTNVNIRIVGDYSGQSEQEINVKSIAVANDGHVMYVAVSEQSYVSVKAIKATGMVSVTPNYLAYLDPTHALNSDKYDVPSGSLEAPRFERAQTAVSRDAKFIYHIAPRPSDGLANLTVVDMPSGASGASVTVRTYVLETNLSPALTAYTCTGTVQNPGDDPVCRPDTSSPTSPTNCVCSGGTRFQAGSTYTYLRLASGRNIPTAPPFHSDYESGNFLGFNVRVSSTNLVITHHNSTGMFKSVYDLRKFKSQANGGVVETETVPHDYQYTFVDEIAIHNGHYIQESSDDENVWIGVRSTAKYSGLSTMYPGVSDRHYYASGSLGDKPNIAATEVIVMNFTLDRSNPIVRNLTLPGNGGETWAQASDPSSIGLTHLLMSADQTTLYARSRKLGKFPASGYLYTVDISSASSLRVDAKGELTGLLAPRSITSNPERTRLFASDGDDKIITAVDISLGKAPKIMSRYTTYCSIVQPGLDFTDTASRGPVTSIYSSFDGTRLEVHCRSPTPAVTGQDEFIELLDVSDAGKMEALTIIGEPDRAVVTGSTVTRGWKSWFMMPLKDSAGEDCFVAETASGNGLAHYEIQAAPADMFFGPTKVNGILERKFWIDTLASTVPLLNPLEVPEVERRVRSKSARRLNSRSLLSVFGFRSETLPGYTEPQIYQLSSDAVDVSFAGSDINLVTAYSVETTASSGDYVAQYMVTSFKALASIRGQIYTAGHLSLSTSEAMLSVTLSLPKTDDNFTFVTSDALSTQASFSEGNRVAQLFGIQSSVNAALKELRIYTPREKSSVADVSVGCRMTDLSTPEVSAALVGIPSVRIANFKYNEHARKISDANDVSQILGRDFIVTMNVSQWFTDSDDELTYTISRRDGALMPTWLSFSTKATPSLIGTALSASSSSKMFNSALNSYADDIPLRIAASDGYTVVYTDFDLKMRNKAPYVTDCAFVQTECPGPDITRVFGTSFVYYLNSTLFSDDDMSSSEQLSIELTMLDTQGSTTALPAWLSFNPQTVSLSGTVESSQGLAPSDYNTTLGAYEKTYSLILTAKEADSVNFPSNFARATLTLNMVNHAPVANGTAHSMVVVSGSEMSVDLRKYFHDADQLPLSFRIAGSDGGGAPSFVRLDPSEKFMLIAPSASHEGKHVVIAFATDGVNDEASTTIRFKVKLTELEAAHWWLLTLLSILSGVSTLLTIYGFVWMVRNYHASSRHWRVIEPFLKTEDDVRAHIEDHVLQSGKKGDKRVTDVEDVDTMEMVQILTPGWWMKYLPDHLVKYLSAHPLFDGRSVPTWLEFDKKNVKLVFKREFFHAELESGLHYVLIIKRSDRSTIDTIDLNFKILSADAGAPVDADALLEAARRRRADITKSRADE